MKINALRGIISCERSVIPRGISWVQNDYLYTGQESPEGYTLDNYRLIQAYKQTYPQSTGDLFSN
ncbi:hypothetical protein EGT71_07100 [Atlantibacter subterranea]|uniref:Uncharacterized protein n=1 Tax=Atlantibacter subterraneus TaxID=255519 RepID=A0A3R9GDJ6_9ENTR|nr:hypothetical protein EGK67_07570 [Atlantibacter subterranea]RSE06366.1 hypothetical protein EGT84_07780 [Atlantibacter subterranea]RSE28144.1 hypothetical protein EGT71_07100 [Atlantibacter subterranea]